MTSLLWQNMQTKQFKMKRFTLAYCSGLQSITRKTWQQLWQAGARCRLISPHIRSGKQELGWDDKASRIQNLPEWCQQLVIECLNMWDYEGISSANHSNTEWCLPGQGPGFIDFNYKTGPSVHCFLFISLVWYEM